MKHIFKVLALGICLGLLLAVVRRLLHIDATLFMRGYWIIALSAIGVAVLINVLYNLSYQQKMRKAAALLEDGCAEEYIAKTEALLQTARGRGLRNILKINLAAGHMEAKQFAAAAHILEELSHERFSTGAVKMCYCLNLCICYFYTAQYDRAKELYQTSRQVFAPFRKNKTYGGNIAEADILAAIMNGQYSQAETLLAAARASWDSPRLLDAFDNIERLLADKRQ